QYFAEFLKRSSLTRLRMLFSPTCVGFRYESTTDSQPSFSRTQSKHDFQGIYPSRIPVSGIALRRIYLSQTPTRLHPHYQSWAHVNFRSPWFDDNAYGRVEEY